VRLKLLNLKKLRRKKQTAVLQKSAVIQTIWHAIKRLLLTGTMPTRIDPYHKARQQLMWHRVDVVKLMKWRPAVQHPAAKVLAVVNLAK
jgi:hypothetical protein